MTTAFMEVDQDSLRAQTLEAAKSHKASWIRFGQFLYTVYKEKRFKNWGFLSFEAYCLKELKIKQATAGKLLKSYYFLEKEEPQLVQKDYIREEEPNKLPDYESVNLLRLAKDNNKLAPQDIAEIRESVLEKGTEPKEVRAQVKKLIAQYDPPKTPEEEKLERKNLLLKRILTTLANTKKQFVDGRLVKLEVIKEIDEFVEKIEQQLEDADTKSPEVVEAT